MLYFYCRNSIIWEMGKCIFRSGWLLLFIVCRLTACYGQWDNKEYLHFDMTLPKSSYLALPELAKPVPGMSLKLYNGATRYNYDPIYKQKIQLDDEGKPFYGNRQLSPTAAKALKRDIDFMTRSGSMGRRSGYSLDRLMERRSWDWGIQRNIRRTQAALGAYRKPEEASGRYEYYHLFEEECSFSFQGSEEAKARVDTLLKEYILPVRGMLYFKYLADGNGNFTLYLPEGEHLRGTFNRCWNGYRLFYKGMELFLLLNRLAESLFQFKMNLTQNLRALYPRDEIEKALLITKASRTAGSDRR